MYSPMVMVMLPNRFDENYKKKGLDFPLNKGE